MAAEQKSMNVVLDASAIIAYIEREAGGNIVKDMLADDTTDCYVHVINLAESY